MNRMFRGVGLVVASASALLLAGGCVSGDEPTVAECRADLKRLGPDLERRARELLGDDVYVESYSDCQSSPGPFVSAGVSAAEAMRAEQRMSSLGEVNGGRPSGCVDGICQRVFTFSPRESQTDYSVLLPDGRAGDFEISVSGD